MTSFSKKRESEGTDEQTLVKQPKVTSDVSLNYDVLTHIFRFLDNKTLKLAALVCKDWKEAAYYPLFWKGTIYAVRRRDVTYKSAISLAQRNIRVVKARATVGYEKSFSVTLANCAELVKCEILYLYFRESLNRTRLYFPQSFDSLKHLALIEPIHALKLQGLERLLFSLVNLRQLYIKCSFTSTEENRSLLKVIFQCLPQLEDLELVNDELLFHHAMAENLVFPQLKRLVVDSQTNWSHRSYTGTNLTRHFPSIKHLKIASDDLGNLCFGTGRDIVSQSLESLYLGYEACGVLFDLSNFITLLLDCLNLRALNLTGIESFNGVKLTEEHFREVIETLPNLSVLTYGHPVSLETVCELMPKMSNFEMLSSVGGREEYPQDQEVIIEFLDKIQKHMPKLFSLLDIECEFGSDLTDYLAKSSNIRYVSTYDDWRTESILKKIETRPHHTLSSDTDTSENKEFEWAKVTRFSPDWHEAVCTHRFTLPDTYDFNLESEASINNS